MKTVKKNSLIILQFAVIILLVTACNNSTSKNENNVKRVLPIFGFHDTELIEKNGDLIVDTIFHSIDNFVFKGHNGEVINQEKVKGKIYVADFFFTHCPSICPIMTKNLKEFHERTKDIDELIILSHTIDPIRDSLERLNEYIKLHEIDTRDDWFFLRGTQEYTYSIGKYDYLINADVDPAAEGGFLHSEHFVLVDRSGRIRGMYEGTDPNEVLRLESDIRQLITIEYGQ